MVVSFEEPKKKARPRREGRREVKLTQREKDALARAELTLTEGRARHDHWAQWLSMSDLQRLVEAVKRAAKGGAKR